MRPRLTNVSSASSMRLRLSMTISSGRMRLDESAWRNSATLFPEKSARLRALALPAFFAAALRAADEDPAFLPDDAALRPADFLAPDFLAVDFFAAFLAAFFPDDPLVEDICALFPGSPRDYPTKP